MGSGPGRDAKRREFGLLVGARRDHDVDLGPGVRRLSGLAPGLPEQYCGHDAFLPLLCFPIRGRPSLGMVPVRGGRLTLASTVDWWENERTSLASANRR